MVFLAERDHLVADLGRAALGEQGVEVHARPEPRDEGVAAHGVAQQDGRAVGHRFAAAHSGDDDLPGLVGSPGKVAAEDDLLPAGGQVGQSLRVDARGAQPFELDFQIAQAGCADFGEQLVGHYRRGVGAGDPAHRSAAQRGDRVQHPGLETARGCDGVEGGRVFAIEALQALGEGDRVGVAGGDHAIADVDHVGVRLVAERLHDRGECRVEVAPTEGVARGDEIACEPDVVLAAAVELLRREPAGGDIAGGEAEVVLFAERAEQGGEQGVLVAAGGGVHGAGGIGEHDQFERFAVGDQVALPGPSLIWGGDQGEEIAVLAAAVRNHGDRRGLVIDGDLDLEIAAWGVLRGAELGLRGVGSGVNARAVGRAFEFFYRQGRVQADVDGQLAQRVEAQHLALQRVAVTVAAVAVGQDLRVGDLDAFFGVAEDREHPRFEEVAAGPFQQAGVAFLAQDGLVDLTRALLLDHVGLDQFAVDPHAEAGDRRVLRQREVEHALEARAGVVDEGLLDGGARDLVTDVDGDLVETDGQRRVAAIDLGDQLPHRLANHGTLEAL